MYIRSIQYVQDTQTYIYIYINYILYGIININVYFRSDCMGFSDMICKFIDNTFDKIEDSISDVFNTIDNVIEPSTHKQSTTKQEENMDVEDLLIHSRFPLGKKEEISKAESEKIRRETEKIAEVIHPVLGKTVKGVNNLGDTIGNFTDSIGLGVLRTLFSSEVNKLEIGDHLFVQRVGYTHHGLYIGNGRIIHYLLERIKEDSLEVFADGAKIHRKDDTESPIIYSVDTVVLRAYRRYGEDNYNLLINNCESFVRWCRNGNEDY